MDFCLLLLPIISFSVEANDLVSGIKAISYEIYDKKLQRNAYTETVEATTLEIDRRAKSKRVSVAIEMTFFILFHQLPAT